MSRFNVFGYFLLLVFVVTLAQLSDTRKYLLLETSSKERESSNPKYVVVNKDDGKRVLIELDNTNESDGGGYGGESLS